MSQPYDLERFVTAQQPVYSAALAELRAGRKRTHWIWFVFPQLAGLGTSPTAARFGITGAGEATAYLRHAVLGPRLHECAAAVVAVRGRTAEEIFGFPDHLKVRSSMTLFARTAPDPAEAADFVAVLQRYYRAYDGGMEDPRTLELLAVG